MTAPGEGNVDRWFDRLMGPRERKDLTPAKRVCNWCARGDDWSDSWEYVNGSRWYHQECINLLDMLA